MQTTEQIASRFWSAFDTSCDFLLEHPAVGSMRRFAAAPLSQARTWPVKGFESFLIFYRADSESVTVFRILHAAQDINSILGLDNE